VRPSLCSLIELFVVEGILVDMLLMVDVMLRELLRELLLLLLLVVLLLLVLLLVVVEEVRIFVAEVDVVVIVCVADEVLLVVDVVVLVAMDGRRTIMTTVSSTKRMVLRTPTICGHLDMKQCLPSFAIQAPAEVDAVDNSCESMDQSLDNERKDICLNKFVVDDAEIEDRGDAASGLSVLEPCNNLDFGAPISSGGSSPMVTRTFLNSCSRETTWHAGDLLTRRHVESSLPFRQQMIASSPRVHTVPISARFRELQWF